MPPKKAEEAAPPAEDDDPLAELATRALPPAFDDDALAALALGKAGAGRQRCVIAVHLACSSNSQERLRENVIFRTLSSICA